MRNYGIPLSALALALGLLGCAGDVGESGSLLRAVDEDAMTSQLLYMVPDLSAIPLTASELEEREIDPSLAIPVRVEVFDDLAVAWFAPDGEAIIGRSSIVALWEVVHRQPIAGELENAPAGESVVTPGSTSFVIDVDASSTDYELAESLANVQESATTPVEQTIIDFFDRVGGPVELYYLGRLEGYHPGCI